MSSRLTLAAVTLTVLTLTACGPTPTPTPTPVETVDEATPTPTATAAPERAELVLPTCEELFTPDEVLTLMGEFMELNPPENTGGGSSFPELVSLLAVDGTLRCTWILPASERGLTVSVRASDAASDAAVTAALTAAGSTGTSTGGDSILYAIGAEETPERSAFTEAHYLAAGLWVAAYDLFGDNAPALTQAAMSRMAELNPTWFAVP